MKISILFLVLLFNFAFTTQSIKPPRVSISLKLKTVHDSIWIASDVRFASKVHKPSLCWCITIYRVEDNGAYKERTILVERSNPNSDNIFYYRYRHDGFETGLYSVNVALLEECPTYDNIVKIDKIVDRSLFINVISEGNL